MTDIQAIKREALESHQARQRSPEYKVVGRHADGTEIKAQTGGWPGDLRAAANASEWFAERIAYLNGPYPASLYTILNSARGGQKAAVAALRTVREENANDQWCVFMNLRGWQNGPMPQDAEMTMNAILAEWHRLGLPVEQPYERVPVVTVNQAELDESDRRRRGGRFGRQLEPVPAGVLPWQ